MATVNDLLRNKGNILWTVPSIATIREALTIMANNHIGAVPVMEFGKVVGIFSERDYARQVALIDELYLDQPVRELMSHPVYIVHRDQTVEECMNVMTAKHIRHLPVMEGDELVGIISIGDVVKHFIEEKNLVIDNLQFYIAGRNNPIEPVI